MPVTNVGTSALAAAEVFAGLTGDELEALRGIALLRQYSQGERVFSLGDEIRTLLVVTAGTVALTLPLQIKGQISEITLEEKGVGSVIAWSSLVPPYKVTLCAKAVTNVELNGFDRETLGRLFVEQPRIQLVITSNLNRVIASRLMLLEALVARDLQRWVAERFS
jgi:CRP-like cAMP-binding protein